jgi:hypothetical protein
MPLTGNPAYNPGNNGFTLVIPDIQQRKLIVPKPTPASGPYTPEYKLDDEVYDEILRICHDLGVHMERQPSLYEKKGEESGLVRGIQVE